MDNVLWKRPKPMKSPLVKWGKMNGKLIQFSPVKLSTIKVFPSNSSDRTLMTTVPVDQRDLTEEEQERLMLIVNGISQLQDEEDTKILVNAKGEIAKVGEPCRLDENVLIGSSTTSDSGYMLG